MSYIIIIQPLFEGREIMAANEIGYKTIVIGDILNMNHVMNADVPIEMDMSNIENVVKKIRDLKSKYTIEGIVTLAEDYIERVAYIRSVEKIGRGPSCEAIKKCKHKELLREALCGYHSLAVKYTVIKKGIANYNIDQFEYPIIIKPSSDTGSRNIYLCNNEDEARNAIGHIQNRVEQFDVLVEEFVDGNEYSAEVCITDGEVNIVAITEKKVLSIDNPVEISHTIPAAINSEQFAEIQQMIKEVVKIINIDDAVIHVEFKLSTKGPKIIEVNGRPGGDNICSLVKYSTGMDLVYIAVCLSLGRYDLCKKTSEPMAETVGINFFYSQKDGTVKAFDEEKLKHNNKVLTYKMYRDAGDCIKRTVDSFSRLGYFISLDMDAEERNKIMKMVEVI